MLTQHQEKLNTTFLHSDSKYTIKCFGKKVDFTDVPSKVDQLIFLYQFAHILHYILGFNHNLLCCFS